MERKVLKKLNSLIKKRGFAYTAALLGEYDTQALKRWVRSESVPEGKLYKIKERLFEKGLSL